MSTMDECPVCLQPFHQDTSPPTRLHPCGHFVCLVCMDILRDDARSSKFNKSLGCPICRKVVQSNCIDLSALPRGSNCSSTSDSTSSLPASLRHRSREARPNEFMRDRSQIAFYGIDNSGSMAYKDGKTFFSHVEFTPTTDLTEVLTTQCRIQRHTSRWAELVESVKLVALYNLNRGIKAVYMLLNTTLGTIWEKGFEVVTVDPSQSRSEQEKQIDMLFYDMLAEDRVYGGTPLSRLNTEFRIRLRKMQRTGSASPNDLVSYSLFTDGMPDAKNRFEQSLKMLARGCKLGSITINLITDDNSVLDYFNGLDRLIGARVRELEQTRFDVVDDLVNEAHEVSMVGNTYLNYCMAFHVARMAGCNSAVADELDERVLPPHYIATLTKEALGLTADAPHFSNLDDFMMEVQTKLQDAPMGWNPRERRMMPLFDVIKLRDFLQRRTVVQKLKLQQHYSLTPLLELVLPLLVVAFVTFVIVKLLF